MSKLFYFPKAVHVECMRYMIVLSIFLPFAYAADIISTVEFNYSGELLATGDKGGRVVIFQREQEVMQPKDPFF